VIPRAFSSGALSIESNERNETFGLCLDSGLVIALSGVRAISIPGHDDLAFKGFTVPNPKFDAASLRIKQGEKSKRATLNSNSGINNR